VLIRDNSGPKRSSSCGIGQTRKRQALLVVLIGVLLATSAAPAPGASRDASRFYVYVGALDSRSVTLAWGAPGAIGRSAADGQTTTVRIAEQTVETPRSWVKIEGLMPDREYAYSVSRGDGELAGGKVRTWPEETASLVFFVIGDWGTGGSNQKKIAQRMVEERARLEQAGKPVRFVLSTGDNLYAKFKRFGTGSSDRHWESRFFRPYRELLSSIPFYAVPGNHDGNESEQRGDLAQYLDNFFFPVSEPARWYRFRFGGLAEFFALDSTRNTLSGPPAPAFSADGEQTRWLKRRLQQAAPPWRIAVLHHPMFSAGPDHPAALPELQHWLDLFAAGGVQVALSGHEHNFQFSERNRQTAGIQFVVSGAGGRLRDGDVRKRMPERAIAAWAPKHHFCVVEVAPDELLVTPVGHEPLEVLDAEGMPVPLPLRVPRKMESEN
jgi:hypothetical protein